MTVRHRRARRPWISRRDDILDITLGLLGLAALMLLCFAGCDSAAEALAAAYHVDSGLE